MDYQSVDFAYRGTGHLPKKHVLVGCLLGDKQTSMHVENFVLIDAGHKLYKVQLRETGPDGEAYVGYYHHDTGRGELRAMKNGISFQGEHSLLRQRLCEKLNIAVVLPAIA